MKRIIKGKIYRINDIPWGQTKGRITLIQGGFSSSIQYPESTIKYITDNAGNVLGENGGDLELWCNEEGGTNSYYEWVLPDGNCWKFTVPIGVSPIEISALRENINNQSPKYETVLNYVDKKFTDNFDDIVRGSYDLAFQNNNLTSNRLTVNHNRNTTTPVLSIYDENSYQIFPTDLKIIDKNNLEIDLTGYTPINGTWKLKIVGNISQQVYELSFANNNVALDILKVNHNENTFTPIVQLFDNSNFQIFPTDIRAIDTNTLEIDFTGLTPIVGVWKVKVV